MYSNGVIQAFEATIHDHDKPGGQTNTPDIVSVSGTRRSRGGSESSLVALGVGFIGPIKTIVLEQVQS